MDEIWFERVDDASHPVGKQRNGAPETAEAELREGDARTNEALTLRVGVFSTQRIGPDGSDMNVMPRGSEPDRKVDHELFGPAEMEGAHKVQDTHLSGHLVPS